jgi:uncharacterized protein with von Willebrand factor type A (vWA) domain
MIRRRLFAALAFGLAVVSLLPAAARAAPPDLELVLAIDVSSSVDNWDYDVQMQGYAAAFQSARLHSAITAAGGNGIAVSVIHWSDAGASKIAIDWTMLRTADDAIRFSHRMQSQARLWAGHLTAIGSAIDFAIEMFDRGKLGGRRQVIDVSGDGRSNHGVFPGEARDRAVARGITVNGLAIMRTPRLDVYYQQNVVGGKDSFVETVEGYHNMADGILRKLIREISGDPVS